VLEPHEDDAFFFKDRYSAFDHTALAVLLEELETDRLMIAGSTFEGCVTQTSIDARELGLKVTVDEAACPRIDPSSAAAASAYLERVVGVRISGIATRADLPGGLPDGSRGGSTL
jgi:nicotinamidase-related amidase